MTNERALFWIFVSVLMAFGLMVGQGMAIAIGAMVAVYVAYERMKPINDDIGVNADGVPSR